MTHLHRVHVLRMIATCHPTAQFHDPLNTQRNQCQNKSTSINTKSSRYFQQLYGIANFMRMHQMHVVTTFIIQGLLLVPDVFQRPSDKKPVLANSLVEAVNDGLVDMRGEYDGMLEVIASWHHDEVTVLSCDRVKKVIIRGRAYDYLSFLLQLEQLVTFVIHLRVTVDLSLFILSLPAFSYLQLHTFHVTIRNVKYSVN